MTMQTNVNHLTEMMSFNPKDHIDASAAHHPNKLKEIPWTPETTPAEWTVGVVSGGALPKADAVIVTWTAAEWQAMCDVLAPNAPEFEYANKYASYKKGLTIKSPALEAGCLARFRTVDCGYKHIILMHSMLHIATDSPDLPLKTLFDQIIDETQCKKIITTGTAGGIGADKKLGDVVVGEHCFFNCHKHLADKPYNHTGYATTLKTPTVDTLPFVEANFDQLKAVNESYMVFNGDIETTDFFAFDTSTDHFGLRKTHGNAEAVEMDDAVLGYVIQQRNASANYVPLWGAVRNVSDPQADMTKYATFEDASRDMGGIYRRYGYWTTVPSVIESWVMAVS